MNKKNGLRLLGGLLIAGLIWYFVQGSLLGGAASKLTTYDEVYDYFVDGLLSDVVDNIEHATDWPSIANETTVQLSTDNQLATASLDVKTDAITVDGISSGSTHLVVDVLSDMLTFSGNVQFSTFAQHTQMMYRLDALDYSLGGLMGQNNPYEEIIGQQVRSLIGQRYAITPDTLVADTASANIMTKGLQQLPQDVVVALREVRLFDQVAETKHGYEVQLSQTGAVNFVRTMMSNDYFAQIMGGSGFSDGQISALSQQIMALNESISMELVRDGDRVDLHINNIADAQTLLDAVIGSEGVKFSLGLSGSNQGLTMSRRRNQPGLYDVSIEFVPEGVNTPITAVGTHRVSVADDAADTSIDMTLSFPGALLNPTVETDAIEVLFGLKSRSSGREKQTLTPPSDVQSFDDFASAMEGGYDNPRPTVDTVVDPALIE